MGMECGTHEGEEHTGFWWEKVKVRARFEILCVNWRIILKLCLKEIYWCVCVCVWTELYLSMQKNAIF